MRDPAGDRRSTSLSRWIARWVGALRPAQRRKLMVTERMTNRWWTLLVRGLFAIAFGVLTILEPAAAVGGFVLLFAVYSLADGVSSLAALTRSSGRDRWLHVVSGL